MGGRLAVWMPTGVRGGGAIGDPCVTQGWLPGRPTPQPTTTGRGSHSPPPSEVQGALCKGFHWVGLRDVDPALSLAVAGSGAASGPGRPCSPSVPRDPGIFGLSRPALCDSGQAKAAGTYRGFWAAAAAMKVSRWCVRSRDFGGVVWVALVERIVRAAWESFSGRTDCATYEGKRPNG